MVDTVTDFNLAYDNARRALQTQVDYWQGIASNLALPDLERSNAITVAATLSQSLLDLAREHFATLTAAAQLGQPGDELLQKATEVLRNLAASTAAAQQGDAVVRATVGALTALAQLRPPAAASAPAAVEGAPAGGGTSSVNAALARTIFGVAQHARARIGGQP